MKNQLNLAFIFILMFAIILVHVRDKERDEWQRKVTHYEHVSDSLQNAVEIIHTNVKAKDSLIVLYMASLDRTLEELNKEAKKNSSVIRNNAILQDSLISTYCRDMARLNQYPDVCR